MTVRVDFEVGEVIILQNLIADYIKQITEEKCRVVFNGPINEEQFTDTLVSIAHKMLIAGQSLGDEMV